MSYENLSLERKKGIFSDFMKHYFGDDWLRLSMDKIANTIDGYMASEGYNVDTTKALVSDPKVTNAEIVVFLCGLTNNDRCVIAEALQRDDLPYYVKDDLRTKMR